MKNMNKEILKNWIDELDCEITEITSEIKDCEKYPCIDDCFHCGWCFKGLEDYSCRRPDTRKYEEKIKLLQDRKNILLEKVVI